MKCPTCECHCTCLCSLFRLEIYKAFVVEFTADMLMGSLREQNMGFQGFLEARNAEDVTFQLSFRPSGFIEEGKHYITGNKNCMVAKWKLVFFPIVSHLVAVITTPWVFQILKPYNAVRSGTSIMWRRVQVSRILLTSIWILIDIPVFGLCYATRGIRACLNSCVLFILFVVQLVADCLSRMQHLIGRSRQIELLPSIVLGDFVYFGCYCRANIGDMKVRTTTFFSYWCTTY